MLKICFVVSIILDAWAALTAFTFHGGSAHGRCRPNARTKKGYPTVVFEVVASHTTRVLHVLGVLLRCTYRQV
jgi:hypothetical protein